MLEALIVRYGYAAVFVGTFLEGETVLVLAGLAAHRGYLAFGGVWLCAFAGTLLGDQLYFHLGRRRGMAWLERRPRWQGRASRARRILDRRPVLTLVGFRFAYGLRTVTPFVVGATGYSPGRFLLWNALGAAAWVTAVEGFGWAFGQAAAVLLGDLERYEALLFAGLAAAGVIGWLVHRARARRLRQISP